jgi:hypothetical protein
MQCAVAHGAQGVQQSGVYVCVLSNHTHQKGARLDTHSTHTPVNTGPTTFCVEPV